MLGPIGLADAGAGTMAFVPILNAPGSLNGTALSLSPTALLGFIPLSPTDPSVPAGGNDPTLSSTGDTDPGLDGSGLVGLSSLANPVVSLLTPASGDPGLPLPPIQLGENALAAISSGTIQSGPDPELIPRSIPEPSVLALFGLLFSASALRLTVRRLRSRREALSPPDQA